jgi:hypothetical protein
MLTNVRERFTEKMFYALVQSVGGGQLFVAVNETGHGHMGSSSINFSELHAK